jgi:hypothetical protein
MLLEEIGSDGTTPRLVFLAHEGPDIVAHLHTAGLERLTHCIGLHIAVIACQRLVHLKLHGLAWMVRKGLHRIERDRLGARGCADIWMDQTIAQATLHGGDRGAEGLGNRLG